ncbi:hypothetical protein PUN28_010993 [Cardiocondyla obscurior]|uniref:Uncharacterized protein n=1 Tax=Cardiocondyla obscurior TaxID=286306 RepID=A0AAW2FK60_9HYME
MEKSMTPLTPWQRGGGTREREEGINGVGGKGKRETQWGRQCGGKDGRGVSGG